MGKLFGTDGVRGKANVAPMDSETILALGRAAATVFHRKHQGLHKVVIGKDTRVSGYMLETALASGLTSMGMDVLLLGPIPTPGVSFMVRSMRADAGVMISASHNSYEDNGIKFFGPDGFKLADETEAEMERLLEPGSVDSMRAIPELIGKAFRIDDAVGRYTVYLKSCIGKRVDFEGLKIVLDTANGAAYKTAPLVFAELGAEIIPLGHKPDGKNINLNCGSLHPEKISAAVKESKADFGIAYDGDADRVIMCDEKGEVFDGDSLLGQIAIEMQEKGTLKGNGVVGTVMSNMGLEVAMKARKIDFYRAKVGDRYVIEEMVNRGLVLGGEQSGHVISLEHNTTGDGILTSLLVAASLVEKGKKLSEFQNVFQRFPQELINIKVKEKRPFEQCPKIQSAVLQAENELKETGRVLLRYSGTEAKARVMVEAEDPAQCTAIANSLADIVKQELGV